MFDGLVRKLSRRPNMPMPDGGHPLMHAQHPMGSLPVGTVQPIHVPMGHHLPIQPGPIELPPMPRINRRMV